MHFLCDGIQILVNAIKNAPSHHKDTTNYNSIPALYHKLVIRIIPSVLHSFPPIFMNFVSSRKLATTVPGNHCSTNCGFQYHCSRSVCTSTTCGSFIGNSASDRNQKHFVPHGALPARFDSITSFLRSIQGKISVPNQDLYRSVGGFEIESHNGENEIQTSGTGSGLWMGHKGVCK